MMERLFDGVYIESAIHTDYYVSMIVLALLSGVAALCLLISTMIASTGQDKSWRILAITTMITLSICAAFVSEISKHNDDIGGYTVYITQDADVNELLSQYRVIKVQGDIWTIEPVDAIRESLE